MNANSDSPRFDESFASVAHGLHLTEVVVSAVVGTLVLFIWLERRGRWRWAQVPVSHGRAAHGPYRSSTFVNGHLQRAPLLLRAASFGCLVFAHLFAPFIVLALTRFPFDGISIPLVPGLAIVLYNWCCAWLLLGRSPHAEPAARTGAKASLIANVGLLCLAAAHLVVVELGRREGFEHACSSTVTLVVFVFAVASVVQALFTVAALRAHGAAMGWRASE
jgi:hypothetical protein